MIQRKFFYSNGLKLSYLDFGGQGEKSLLLLHGHFGNARMFSSFAYQLKGWKIYGLDQRGHGWSEHPKDQDYSRESYIQDIYNFVNQVIGKSVTILGHSLGGLNAYQFAYRYPELVNGLIIEDIGAEIQCEASFVRLLPDRVSSFIELQQALRDTGMTDFDYFGESAFEDEKGWGFRFDAKGLESSHLLVCGDYWKEWLGTTCPVLLLHGKKSWALTSEHAEIMASRRPNTNFVIFNDCGHTIHQDDPDGFFEVSSSFLNGIQQK